MQARNSGLSRKPYKSSQLKYLHLTYAVMRKLSSSGVQPRPLLVSSSGDVVSCSAPSALLDSAGSEWLSQIVESPLANHEVCQSSGRVGPEFFILATPLTAV